MDPAEVCGRLWELLSGFILTQALSAAAQRGAARGEDSGASPPGSLAAWKPPGRSCWVRH
jgi:hypothetical protein